MDISKSSRHSKIAGDFGEGLVLYWLSKYGFECARVDHTGIDLIASHPNASEIMGISVKSRTRGNGTENEYVSLKNGDFEKAEAACLAFGCVPYFAIVVDANNTVKVFITSMAHLLELFPRSSTGASGWKMSTDSVCRYLDDPKIIYLEMQTNVARWWA